MKNYRDPTPALPKDPPLSKSERVMRVITLIVLIAWIVGAVYASVALK